MSKRRNCRNCRHRSKCKSSDYVEPNSPDPKGYIVSSLEALRCKAEPELDGCMYANILINAMQEEIDRLKIVVVENNQQIQYLNEMLGMERNRIANLQSRLMERY